MRVALSLYDRFPEMGRGVPAAVGFAEYWRFPVSYNIDSIDYLGEGVLRIGVAERKSLAKKFRSKMAESNFLEDDDAVEATPGDPSTLVITHPFWTGEFSGNSEDALLAALKKTKGSAELLLTWEGGDSFTGLRVVDGKVTKHEIRFSLGDECK